MQDIHSIGGGGRFFAGGDGDRRLRPHHHHHNPNHQALKCPRCDSINTKFCYYNNYNLSQPRHFCKSCRRYWTKGGVLRNVPVGGGCRKTKLCKPKPSSETATTTAAFQRKSNADSSSESSSLTATATAVATEAVSAIPSTSAPNLTNIRETKFLVNAQNANLNFETGDTLLDQQRSDCGILSEIGNFTSLMTSSNESLPFEFGNISDDRPFRLSDQGAGPDEVQDQHHQMMVIGEELRMQEITTGLLDQTAQIDLSARVHDRSTNVGFEPLDWQGGGDQSLFDIPNAVDQAYWNQNQWGDQDHSSLYLP